MLEEKFRIVLHIRHGINGDVDICGVWVVTIVEVGMFLVTSFSKRWRKNSDLGSMSGVVLMVVVIVMCGVYVVIREDGVL